MTSVEQAADAIGAGGMVVVVDEADAQTPGHVVLGAQRATAEAITFLTRRAGGWIGLALAPERCDELGLRVMSLRPEAVRDTPFTVTIEARDGVTTGISTADQAHTIRTAADPAKGRADIVVPGHVRPLKARAGGVLERAGHIEASVDLARLAGLAPAGVICPVRNEDGSVAGLGELDGFVRRHGLPAVTIADLIAHRRRHERLVERVGTTALATAFGRFAVHGYRSLVDDRQHVALVKGDVAGVAGVLVRVHAGCLAGDVLRSLGCDCAARLESALTLIEAEGAGVLLYLGQHGFGGHHPREAPDVRDAGVAIQILAELGVSSSCHNAPLRVVSEL
ncbi:Riboflavin biosynthesis protein RibBA [Baekduia alba]|uniref:3,4-dihydroxy-2-butanone-4-phosphate synthase n=1 Tax=Baekduia alba TaxID=2997333 RepID=UPI002340A754|nr:3,4-dihydroxy-2-butanone-4-phosphate synthase [Baekduia alba]WCB95254.1 Riboflavin biosynthesis protein RibBA [Baekduia alba]